MRWFRFPRVLGLIVVFYLAGMAVLFGLLTEKSVDFLDTAATTPGTVIALVPKAPAGSRAQPPNSRMVSLAPKVSYLVDGTSYEYTAAHGRFRQHLRVGDTVQVLYVRSDPSVARLKGEGRLMVPAIAAGFALATVVVAAILVRTRNLGVPGKRPAATPELVESDRSPVV